MLASNHDWKDLKNDNNVSRSCSYLSFLRLFAAHVSQALDLGLQLLRLSGDLLDLFSHLLALLGNLVTLPGEQFSLGFLGNSFYLSHLRP